MPIAINDAEARYSSHRTSSLSQSQLSSSVFSFGVHISGALMIQLPTIESSHLAIRRVKGNPDAGLMAYIDAVISTS